MPISFSCDGCGKDYLVSDGLAGKRASCKACGTKTTIPDPDVAEPVSAPRPVPASARAATAVPVAKLIKPASTPRPPADDIYGLDEPVAEPLAATPLPSRVRTSFDPVSPGEGAPAKKSKKGGFFGSGAKSKKSSGGSFGSGGIGFGGIRLVMVVVFFSIGGVSYLMSRGTVESYFKRYTELAQRLVSELKPVNDVASARRAAPKLKETLRLMVEHHEKNKDKKAKQTLIDEMSRRYQAQLKEAERDLVGELSRIAMIPGAIVALDIEQDLRHLAAIEEEMKRNAGPR